MFTPSRVITCAFFLSAVPTGYMDAGKATAQQPTAKVSDTIEVPAFELPASTFLTPEARRALQGWKQHQDEVLKMCSFNKEKPFDEESTPALRECLGTRFFPSIIARYRSQYNVQIRPETIAGIYTENITPAEGVPSRNRKRVLINLHGGGFTGGARFLGQIESIPIAGVGKFKVVSIDYRMAPEYRFPAAREDAAAVYRSLLKTYRPEDIGIYGCSSGAVLTAQTVAWLEEEGLPAPGAIGMFCGAGSYWSEGDSGHIQAAITGSTLDTSLQHPYFKDTDPNDPLVFPARSAQVLAKFPPSLLITGTRDLALSSVVAMHSRLVALGVRADLHVWEGLGHAFFYEPNLPEAREMYDVTVHFFDRYLGKPLNGTTRYSDASMLRWGRTENTPLRGGHEFVR